MEEPLSPIGAPISPEQTSSGEQAVAELNLVCIDEILPPELLDNVFDTLRRLNDCKAALFACSLVSRGWREMTLRHRFHTLVFVINYQTLSEPPYSHLFDFIESDVYRHVHASVRSLSLCWPSEFKDSIAPEFFTTVVNHFPSLQRLHLSGPMEGRSPWQEQAVQSYQPIMPNIRVLSLCESTSIFDEVDGWSCLHLCEILRCFESLDELWIQNGGTPLLEDEAFNLQNVPLPEVRILLLRNMCSTGPMGGIIKRLAGQRPLERLDLRDYSMRLQDADGILECLDATPEHIRLNLLGWTEVGNAVELSWPWDLKCLTFVPELPIGLFDTVLHPMGREKAVRVNSKPWEVMIKSLAALDSRSLLERINCHITFFDLVAPNELVFLKLGLDELSTTVLPRFEKALLRLHTDGRLKHVAVHFYKDILYRTDGLDYYQLCPEAAEYLRTLFPGLDAAGILEV